MQYSGTLLTLALLLLIGCNKNAVITVPDDSIASGSHILITQDKGFLITGVDQKNGYSSRGWVSEGSGAIIRLNEKKEVVWKKQHSFLKFSSVYDIVEAENQDILLVSPLRENHHGGRGDENLSYLTRLSKDGAVIYQKKFLGVLMKLVEKTNGETLIVGLNNIGFEESINSFVFHPFINCIDKAGNIVWSAHIDDNVNWIEEAYLKKGILHINATSIESTFDLAITPKAVRKIYNLDQSGELISTHGAEVSTNEIDFTEEDLAVEFMKNPLPHKDKWVLQVKDEPSGKTTYIDLGQYAELNLLPRLRLGYLHVCTQSKESYKALNQITSNGQGEVFITVAIINDLKQKVEASLSTQAYCHNNIDGFLVLKLDKERALIWSKKIEAKALPLNIKSIEGGGVAIVGTLTRDNGALGNAKEERLYYLLLDGKGKARK